MANAISGLASLQQASQIERSEFSTSPSTRRVGGGRMGPDFADAFASAIDSAANDERVAEEMSVKFADGDTSVGIHDVVIASERANVSMRYTVTLKNKLLEAYRELMNTQV